VKDADGLLGDGAVTLTNMKDTADVHSFKSGEAVSLTIGEVYKVSCAVNNAIIKINNSTIYKASRETTNANVVISAKDADLHELDLSGGLLKGQTYEGGISVLADMPYTSNTLEACGVLYEGTVQTPKENPSPNNGAIPTTGAAVKLVAEKAGKLKVTVSLVSKVYYFLEETANGPKEVLKFDNTTNTQTGGKVLILPVEAGKTYYLYTHGSKIKMYGITVDYRTSLDWNKIETPVLGTPSVKGGTISVPYTAQVGGIYAETLDVTMYDANGKAVNKQSITTEGESGVAEFTPAASGTYSFKAELIRTGEASEVSNTTTSVNFVLPMATPAGLNAENKGHGDSQRKTAEKRSQKYQKRTNPRSHLQFLPFNRKIGRADQQSQSFQALQDARDWDRHTDGPERRVKRGNAPFTGLDRLDHIRDAEVAEDHAPRDDDKIDHDIHDCLHARRILRIKQVDFDVLVMLQKISAGQNAQRAENVQTDIACPDRRIFKNITCADLPEHDDHNDVFADRQDSAGPLCYGVAGVDKSF